MFSTLWWLSYRLLRSPGTKLFTFSGWIAVAGLVIGVACLVVSMAVMSGFESTLQKSVSDVAGHIQVLRPTFSNEDPEKTLARIREIEPTLEAATRFVFVEGVLAHQGELSGAVLQGMDPDQVTKVLGLESRVVEGKFDISADGEVPLAMIGKGIAKKFNLKVGDDFRLVLPLASDFDPTQFRRKLGKFRVAGVVDLGKHEYDERMVIASMSEVQKLAELKNRFSGFLLRFQDIEQAREIGKKLSENLGPGYRVRDWREVNENLFEAVKIEKVVIFFVILLIIIAAAFTVASSLYINVVKRYSDIGLLKAVGLSPRNVVKIFSLQGLTIGALGLAGGFVVGILFCVFFSWAESKYGLIPGSIYKIDRIDLSIRWTDALAITFATLLISFFATLAPAFKGARLTPVEGLKNE